MKNLLHFKAVKTGTHKVQVGAGAGSGADFSKVGAGAETNSFGSATLHIRKMAFKGQISEKGKTQKSKIKKLFEGKYYLRRNGENMVSEPLYKSRL
jgi:hypothetical protein